MTYLGPMTAIIGIAALSACAAPSAQHASQAADHSAQATGHSVAAAATSTATVAAVPVAATGAVLSVSGAALADVGNASVKAAVDVIDHGAGDAGCTVAQTCVAPDGPPTLN